MRASGVSCVCCVCCVIIREGLGTIQSICNGGSEERKEASLLFVCFFFVGGEKNNFQAFPFEGVALFEKPSESCDAWAMGVTRKGREGRRTHPVSFQSFELPGARGGKRHANLLVPDVARIIERRERFLYRRASVMSICT